VRKSASHGVSGVSGNRLRAPGPLPPRLTSRSSAGRPLAEVPLTGLTSPLRNDNFTVADMYEIYTGKKSATRIALKTENVKRRNEAETLIKEHPDTSKAAQK